MSEQTSPDAMQPNTSCVSSAAPTDPGAQPGQGEIKAETWLIPPEIARAALERRSPLIFGRLPIGRPANYERISLGRLPYDRLKELWESPDHVVTGLAPTFVERDGQLELVDVSLVVETERATAFIRPPIGLPRGTSGFSTSRESPKPEVAPRPPDEAG